MSKDIVRSQSYSVETAHQSSSAIIVTIISFHDKRACKHHKFILITLLCCSNMLIAMFVNASV